jgi:hypothetical protein
MDSNAQQSATQKQCNQWVVKEEIQYSENGSETGFALTLNTGAVAYWGDFNTKPSANPKAQS